MRPSTASNAPSGIHLEITYEVGSWCEWWGEGEGGRAEPSHRCVAVERRKIVLLQTLPFQTRPVPRVLQLTRTADACE